MALKKQSPTAHLSHRAWKHFTLAGVMSFGLGVACSAPEDSAPVFEGSCPILIECASKLVPNQQFDQVIADLEEAYGPDGSCWASGLLFHEQCRDSCRDALASYNFDAIGLGTSCGQCDIDSDCTDFGNDAVCRSGYCSRRELGDLENTTLATGDGDGDDDTASTGTNNPTIPPLDPACDVPLPRVVFETTLGNMTVEMDSAVEPDAVNLFLVHISDDYYDNMLFHQVTAGVSLQSGTFRPGLNLGSPLFSATPEDPPALTHNSTTLALTSIEGVLSPQFYLSDDPGPASDSPGLGVAIGQLVAGTEVRDAIAAVDVSTVTWMGFTLRDLPLDDVVIEQAYCE